MSRSRLISIAVGGVIALALLVGGGLWWADRQHYEATDNAFVEADTAPVSALAIYIAIQPPQFLRSDADPLF